MKSLYLHLRLAVLSLLIFSACTQDEMLTQTGENADTSDVLTIRSVNIADFTTGATTRVINNGVMVTFEAGSGLEDTNGDEIGVLLIGDDEKGFANAPFKYINENGENKWINKNGVSYTGKIKKAIAYFPYASMMKDGKEFIPSSVDELKEFKRSEETVEFKYKDLLIAEIDDIQSPLLTIDFEHAFSLITFSAESTIEVAGEEISYLLDLTGVAFSIGDEQYTPEFVNGKYVCLVEKTELVKDDFRYFYTIDNITYAKTLKETMTLSPNQSYAFPCSTSSEGVAGVAAGDFYCVSDATGNAIIVPGNAAAIPVGLTCKGIVFHVMENFDGFCTENGLTGTDMPGYNGKHGLIVSTLNGQAFGMQGVPADITNVKLAFTVSSINNYNNTDVSNGYKLTKALKEAAAQGSITFAALGNHTENASTSATSWYAPSFNELKYMIRGVQWNEVSTDGQEYINKQLSKVGGSRIESTIPSITFNEGFYLMQNGAEMGWRGIPGAETYRPVCAF